MLDHSISRSLCITIRRTVETIVKYRYLIALVLFVILVLFKVNGSSISVYGESSIQGSIGKPVLFGKVRPIRSDEWMVQTPYFIAQANSKTPYSVVNPDISLSGQNMIVSYGAPVWDISTLAKPLNWGFLLFGSSYGLSWYWCMKTLLLILLSFELCMMITRKNLFVSILGAFWITYSPAVQWWFMQHVGDIIFYMEAVVVLFYYFFRYFNKILLKIIFAFLFALSCVGFALTVYPAIQVPLFYLGLLLCALIFWDFRKTIKFKTIDYVISGVAVLLIVFLLMHVYLISKDAISAILNTTYPGHRVSRGGEGAPFAVNNFLTNVFLPFKDIPNTISNNCEISGFYNFLPAVLLALPLLIKRKVGNLKYGIALAVFSLLSIAYLYMKIPVFLAKATLLSYVTYRIEIAYGIASVYLSIWALSEFIRSKSVSRMYSSVLSLLIGLFYFITVDLTPIKGYVRLRYYLAFILTFIVLNYLLLRGKKFLFSSVMIIVIMISGLFVNPVNIGLGNMFHNNLTSTVQSIKKQNPNARWIALNGSSMGSYLYALGIKDLDGTDYYPDMKKWKLLDPDGKYMSVYNRYAHVTYVLTNRTTDMSTIAGDSILVNLNVNDLRKLKVGYILAKNRLEAYANSGTRFRNLTSKPANGYFIYQVEYW